MAYAIPFDTLAFVRELETAGVPPVQAEAQANALSGVLHKIEESRFQELATKGDIELVKGNIELVKADIELVKAELRKDIETAKAETIKWVVGLALAQLAMLAGILMTMLRILPLSH